MNLVGRWLFAIAMVAFGVQNFMYTGYLKGLELTPEWAHWHTFWAYLDGALLVAGGIGIALRKRWGPVIAGLVYFASVLFLRLPRAGMTIHNLSERTVLLEALALGCAAFLLTGARGAYRVVFGICMIFFGIDHFQALRFVAALVPKWLPGSLFWSGFTGAALVAAGTAFITRWQMRLAATLLGLMFFLWVAILHGPRVAADLHNPDGWNSLFVAVAMCGACWVLAE